MWTFLDECLLARYTRQPVFWWVVLLTVCADVCRPMCPCLSLVFVTNKRVLHTLISFYSPTGYSHKIRHPFVCPMQFMTFDRYKTSLECLSVSLSVCPKYISLSIATAVFVRSSSNLKCRSHIKQRTASSRASNTGSSKGACASIYFRGHTSNKSRNNGPILQW